MAMIPITILHDPNGIFSGVFGTQDFNISLRTGTWPPGMRVEREGCEYTVKTFTAPFAKFGWQHAQYRRTWALVNGHSLLIPAYNRGGATLKEVGRWTGQE